MHATAQSRQGCTLGTVLPTEITFLTCNSEITLLQVAAVLGRLEYNKKDPKFSGKKSK